MPGLAGKASSICPTPGVRESPERLPPTGTTYPWDSNHSFSTLSNCRGKQLNMANIKGIEIHVDRPLVYDLRIAYKFGTGPYQKAETILSQLSKLFPDEDTIGIFYDDPVKTPAADLRWVAGVILGEGDEPADPNLEMQLAGLGYRFFHLPEADQAVQTRTPTTGPLSISAAVEQTYPAINKFLEERNLDAHPWIEIYEEKTTLFMGPLDRQEQFHVPEAVEAAEAAEKQKLPPVAVTAC